MECSVCCETYNKRGRKPVECPGCNFNACQNCVQRFLLDDTNSSDPQCMNCKRPWLFEFIVDNFPKSTFVDGVYKKRREDVLFERERSYLPATQIELERDARVVELGRDVLARRDQIAIIKMEIAELEQRQARLRMGLPEDDGITAAASARKATVFVRACPADGCHGFLSSSWKCGLCNVQVCKDCHDILPTVADGQEVEEHVCNPDALATARVLARDTKPCPNCHAMIHKIDGCDQMFCTQCHVAFSWRTGELVRNNRIHNPHYYEYMRQQNNGMIPREPGDIVGDANGANCDGLPSVYSFNTYLSLNLRKQGAQASKLHDAVLGIYRCLVHIRDVEMERYPAARPVDLNANMDIRKQFMLGKITDAAFKAKLQQREKKRSKCDEVNQVLAMTTQVGTDNLRAMFDMMRNGQNGIALVQQVEAAVKNCEGLRAYVNDSLLHISKRYNNSVPNISSEWIVLTRQN